MDLVEALGDQQRQTRQLSPVVSIVRDREIAARCKDHFEGFEKQQHECNKPTLNYIHTRFSVGFQCCCLAVGANCADLLHI